ncbi:MAG TPA: SDR family oxidoreductase [Stellaceae bacterium]|jgi:NAD(P)-dependent dehydrogenase (short-subunit alcohol dehydrogenase family)
MALELNLKGRTVLVTGASKGLGLAAAKGFAAEGCNLYLSSRNAEKLEFNAAELRNAYGVEVGFFPLDLSLPAAREKLIAACADVDILINNAGMIPGGSIDDVDDDAWRAGWELKVYGYIHFTRAYLKLMRARGKGVIVNMIGAAGESLDYDYAAGAVGNASLMAFTRAIGSRSIDYGVRVVGINPGPTDTDRIGFLSRKRAKEMFGDESRYTEFFKNYPLKRPATLDEITPAVLFLASDLSSYTSGAILTINAGMTYRRQR